MRSPENHDRVNGQWVPQLLVDRDHELTGHHRGTIRVRAGQFVLAGTVQGTLWVDAGAQVRITGRQQGEVRVAPGAQVAVAGALHGSATLEPGATLLVEPGGRLAGDLVNGGQVVVRGVFGGDRSGPGEFRLEGDGYVEVPTTRNG